ncbi:MAG: hypothetical protein WC120_05335 [Parcubacteria group bacterium]|jgi:hypothetical protein
MSKESDLQGQIDRLVVRVGLIDGRGDPRTGFPAMSRKGDLEDVAQRVEGLDRGAKMEAQTSLELRGMIGELALRIGALERHFEALTAVASGVRKPLWQEEAQRPWLPGHEPPPPTCGTCRFNPGSAIVLGVSCETCKWFKPDGPYKPYRPLDFKESGICRAHPMVVAKMSDDTCGEHSPR